MAGRTLTLNGEQCCDFPNRYLIDSSLRNHGTVVWTFGAITLRNTSTVTNEIDGTWEVQGNQTVTFDGGGTPAFVNDGVLLRSGAPNRLTVTPPFTNTGTLHVRIGGAGAGEFDEFGGGTVNLGGTLSAQLINGFSPPSSDQFKVMDYTSISGAFATLTGDGFTFSACYTPTALFVCNVITEKLTPTITWENPADISIRHGAQRHATERHGLGARDVQVFAGRRDDAERRERSDPAGHLHPDGHRSLQQRKRERPDQRRSSDARLSRGRTRPTSSTERHCRRPSSMPRQTLPGRSSTRPLRAWCCTPATLSFCRRPLRQPTPPTTSRSTRPAAINVLAKPLTVTAANAAKVFGAPLPSFSANFTGFVNADTPANLTGTLSLSTTATPSSPVGPYPIVPSGVSSSDYIIAFQPGTLTISRASTTTTLYVLPATTGFLQPNVLIAVVAPVGPGAGVPDGAVQFRDGATPLGPATLTGGIAYIFVNGLAPGAHSMTALYAGSSNFTGSTSAPGATTVSALAASTFTLLVPAANPRAAGQPATLDRAGSAVRRRYADGQRAVQRRQHGDRHGCGDWRTCDDQPDDAHGRDASADGALSRQRQLRGEQLAARGNHDLYGRPSGDNGDRAGRVTESVGARSAGHVHGHGDRRRHDRQRELLRGRPPPWQCSHCQRRRQLQGHADDGAAIDRRTRAVGVICRQPRFREQQLAARGAIRFR